MNPQPNESKDQLGIGLYSMVEAARLLHTPRRTLARWVEGYIQQLRSGERNYAPIIEREEESALTFADLVELLYVRGFRDAGVPLDDIRKAGAKYRQRWQAPYPLATKRFATDGRALLLQEGDVWRHALTGQHQAFVDELGKRLIHTGDLASEWRPLGPERTVVLNPDRAFGKPIDVISGTQTFVLAEALAAGEKPDEVAWWYGTTTVAVEDARAFERSLVVR